MASLLETLVNRGSQSSSFLQRIPNIPGLNNPIVAKARVLQGQFEKNLVRGNTIVDSITRLLGIGQVDTSQIGKPNLNTGIVEGSKKEKYEGEIAAIYKDGYFARPTNFFVDFITYPIHMTDKKQIQLLGLKCADAQIGQVALNTIDHRHSGSVRKFANNVNYNDFTLSFYATERHPELTFFTDWMNEAVNTKNFSVGYYDQYFGEIDVYQLATSENPADQSFKNSEVIFVQKYTECYPISINAIPLSFASLGVVEKIFTTWAWR